MVWESEVTVKCRTGRENKTYVWKWGEGKRKKNEINK